MLQIILVFEFSIREKFHVISIGMEVNCAWFIQTVIQGLRDVPLCSLFVISWDVSDTEEKVESTPFSGIKIANVIKLCVAWTCVTRVPLHGMTCRM